MIVNSHCGPSRGQTFVVPAGSKMRHTTERFQRKRVVCELQRQDRDLTDLPSDALTTSTNKSLTLSGEDAPAAGIRSVAQDSFCLTNPKEDYPFGEDAPGAGILSVTQDSLRLDTLTDNAKEQYPF
jgi:hypothetical protein